MTFLFEDLPCGVRDAVDLRVGGVLGFAPARRGGHAHLTGTIRSAAGRVFIKGVRDSDVKETASLLNEAVNLPAAGPLAPTLLWHVQADGWNVLGLEAIDGHHPDYRPGSLDLPIVASAVAALGNLPSAGPSVTISYTDRFGKCTADPTPLAGDAMLHCDLNPGNILIAPDGSPRVVDWALTARGARWLEAAMLIPWLLQNGHTPTTAEEWAAEYLPLYTTAPPAALDRLAELLAERFTRRRAAGVGAVLYREAATAWHAWRSRAA